MYSKSPRAHPGSQNRKPAQPGLSLRQEGLWLSVSSRSRRAHDREMAEYSRTPERALLPRRQGTIGHNPHGNGGKSSSFERAQPEGFFTLYPSFQHETADHRAALRSQVALRVCIARRQSAYGIEARIFFRQNLEICSALVRRVDATEERFTLFNKSSVCRASFSDSKFSR